MAVVSVEFMRSLVEYSAWARGRLLRAASGLTFEEFVKPAGLDHGSIHETLVHALASQILWLERWLGLDPDHILSPEDFPTFDAVQEEWHQQHLALLDYLSRLTDDDLVQTIDYTTRGGQLWADPLWQSMFQVLNHETQHRSEVALILTQMGHSPGFLDYIAFTHRQ